MTITKVEALHLRLPCIDEIAAGTQGVLVIRIYTDAGLVGIARQDRQALSQSHAVGIQVEHLHDVVAVGPVGEEDQEDLVDKMNEFAGSVFVVAVFHG